MTDLADVVLQRLRRAYSAAADPDRAAPMAAYMRDRFPFLGLPSGPRRQLDRQILAGTAKPTEPDLVAVAIACWALPEREYQYFACDWLRRHARLLSPGSLPTVRRLIVERAWWDTVDILAAHVVGTLVARHPALVATMDAWVDDAELWLVRTALLHQLRYGGDTDELRLFRYCAAQAGHPDFFVRKAIGWALREHAKTAPDRVRAFVAAHPELSGLSTREALKHL